MDGEATSGTASQTVLAGMGREMNEAALRDLTEETIAYCWAGIHYPVDNDAGIFLGRKVDYLMADRAQNDEAT